MFRLAYSILIAIISYKFLTVLNRYLNMLIKKRGDKVIELKVIFKDKNKRSLIIKDLKKIHTMHTTNMAYVFASTPFAYGSGLYKHFDLKLNEVESITKDDELVYLNKLE